MRAKHLVVRRLARSGLARERRLLVVIVAVIVVAIVAGRGAADYGTATGTVLQREMVTR